MAESSVQLPPGRKPGGQPLSSDRPLFKRLAALVFPNSSDPGVPCSHGHGRQPFEECQTPRNIIMFQICVISQEHR